MACKLKSHIFFLVIFAWLGGIIVVSLLFNTSNLREGLFPSKIPAFNDEGFEHVEGSPSGSSLSVLADNRVSADCCPSTYTTSNGCVCLAKEQLEDMRARGGNNAF